MLDLLKKILLKQIHKSSYSPGHYYSPIPNLKEIEKNRDRVFQSPPGIIGIDLNEEGQREFLNNLRPYINEISFSPVKGHSNRYFARNDFFVESDALYYNALLKFKKPKRVVEVGSGFSSAVLFDVIDTAGLKLESVHFIEPYPDRLIKLLKTKDEDQYVLHKSRVQDVAVELFTSLGSDDILFIDSSHISKIGSDVNFLIFEILPILKPGVLIHLHDILYPFEYPEGWVFDGRFWNEAYLLKAFLMFNPQFKVIIFNNYLAQFHRAFLEEIDSRLLASGGSIWIEKI
jgi:hypothetical protein